MTLSRPELVEHLTTICNVCDLGGFGEMLALRVHARRERRVSSENG